MWEGFPKGSKLATPQKRAQLAMEAEAKNKQRSEEARFCVPRKNLHPPPSLEGSGRSNRHQKTLLSKAWGEEMEV